MGPVSFFEPHLNTTFPDFLMTPTMVGLCLEVLTKFDPKTPAIMSNISQGGRFRPVHERRGSRTRNDTVSPCCSRGCAEIFHDKISGTKNDGQGGSLVPYATAPLSRSPSVSPSKSSANVLNTSYRGRQIPRPRDRLIA